MMFYMWPRKYDLMAAGFLAIWGIISYVAGESIGAFAKLTVAGLLFMAWLIKGNLE